MDHNNKSVRDPWAVEALDSYLSLPLRYRRRDVMARTLRAVLETGDARQAMRFFRDGMLVRDWLWPSGAYPRRSLHARRRTVASVLDSSALGRKVLCEGIGSLWSAGLHPADRAALVDLARMLTAMDRSFWSARLWRMLSDPYCLYATLDHAYIEREISSGGVSPEGSFQLLHGGRRCQELYFRVGFPYYSRREQPWGPFSAFLRDHPWAWCHFLTTDMHPSLLRSMLRQLHDMPPSARPAGSASFVEGCRGPLSGILGDEAYLMGSPSDYEGVPDETLEAMDDGLLLRTGAVGYLPSSLGRRMRLRIAMVKRSCGTRVSVLCSDSDVPEVREALYEDMARGQPVVLWRTGAIAMHRLDGNPALAAAIGRLTATLRSMPAESDGPLPSPVSSYLSSFRRCLDHLCDSAGVGRLRLKDISRVRDMSAGAVALAMCSMPPDALAQEVFSSVMDGRRDTGDL